MKKVNQLIDGTTVINFPFYFKLFSRYKKSSIFIVLLLLFGSFFFYFSQENVYISSINFSDVGKDSQDSSSKAMSGLIGETRSASKAIEILNLRSSMDFNRSLAKKLLTLKNFNSLKLDSGFVIDGNFKFASKLNKKCNQNEDCLADVIGKVLPKLYTITDKDRNGINFVIEVTTLDSMTSNLLLENLIKTIQESRVEIVKYNLAEQIKQNTEILIGKKNDVDIESFYQSMEEKDKIENELKEIQSKLDHQINVVTTAQDNLNSAEASYQYNKRFGNKKINQDDLELEQRRKLLKERLEKLNSDLVALEDISNSQSPRDIEIINQFKKEIKETKKKLAGLGEESGKTSLNTFVEQSKEKIHTKELEYNVLKDQLFNAKLVYDDYVLKKKDLVGKKIKLEQGIDILKPNIEYIKNLEIKIEQMKLLQISASSDVKFDNYPIISDPFKKVNLLILFASLVAIGSFLIAAYLSLRFLADDYIYDEDDILNINEELKSIGQGPNYL